MNLPLKPRNRLSLTAKGLCAGNSSFPPERLTMQEGIKLMIECLFGKSGLGYVYDTLEIHDHLDRELETMENFELLAIHDLVVEMEEAARTEASVE